MDFSCIARIALIALSFNARQIVIQPNRYQGCEGWYTFSARSAKRGGRLLACECVLLDALAD